jgi:hypothetical protein
LIEDSTPKLYLRTVRALLCGGCRAFLLRRTE